MRSYANVLLCVPAVFVLPAATDAPNAAGSSVVIASLASLIGLVAALVAWVKYFGGITRTRLCSGGPSRDLHASSSHLVGVPSAAIEPNGQMEPDQFFTLALDMLCVADFDGYFQCLNPAWERTLGWSSAELQARPYLDFVHPEDRAATKAEARKLTTGRDTLSFENRYLCKDGSYRWLLWSSTPFPGQRLIYAAARDITEWRLTAEEFRVARDIQQKLFPAVGPALAGYDIAGASYPLGAAGGDYFDYLPLHGGGLGVALGDAAGHGVGPALLMATTRASLRALGQSHEDLGTLLTLTNNTVTVPQ